MIVPSRYRKSANHRKAWAVMEHLQGLDPAGPVVKGAADLAVLKAAHNRHREVLEARAEDAVRAYLTEERHQVVSAVSRGVTPGEALKSLHDDVLETVGAIWRSAAAATEAWAARTTPLVAKGPRVQSVDAQIEAWLKRNLGKRVVGITETRRKQLAATIKAGQDEGENLGQLAKRVDRLYLDDIIPNRSQTIARTETAMATNFTQHVYAVEAASNAGVEMEKEWMALGDDRTRDDHAQADGQRVALDDRFEVGGDRLAFPGDPAGSAEEVINCRCSVMYHVMEEKSAGIYTRTAKRAEEESIYTETLSPAQFAKTMVGVHPDVMTLAAFAAGVFGDGDDFTTARAVLAKHAWKLNRFHKAVSEWDELKHPRDDHGRFAEAGGHAPGPVGPVPVYSPEGQRRAEETRKWKNGTELRYEGGSKVNMNPGEHVVVRGVWGMNEKSGAIYYNIETKTGQKFTIVDTKLREPKPGEVPAEPAPKAPKAPRKPKPEEQKPEEKPKPPEEKPKPPEEKPKPPEEPKKPEEKPAPRRRRTRKPYAPPGGGQYVSPYVRPEPRFRLGDRPPADYADKTPHEMEEVFKQRHLQSNIKLQLAPTREARLIVTEMDRMAEKYPFVNEHVWDIRVDTDADVKQHFVGTPYANGVLAYANKPTGTIAINQRYLDQLHEQDARETAPWFAVLPESEKDRFRTENDVFLRSQRSGFHPPGSRHVQYNVITHEFGHHLDYTLMRDPIAASEWKKFKEENVFTLRHVSDYANTAYASALRAKKGMTDKMWPEYKYMEPVAEAFANYEAWQDGAIEWKDVKPGARALGKFLQDHHLGNNHKPLGPMGAGQVLTQQPAPPPRAWDPTKPRPGGWD